MAKLDQISTIPNLFGYFGSITTSISQKRFSFTFLKAKTDYSEIFANFNKMVQKTNRSKNENHQNW